MRRVTICLDLPKFNRVFAVCGCHHAMTAVVSACCPNGNCCISDFSPPLFPFRISRDIPQLRSDVSCLSSAKTCREKVDEANCQRKKVRHASRSCSVVAPVCLRVQACCVNILLMATRSLKYSFYFLASVYYRLAASNINHTRGGTQIVVVQRSHIQAKIERIVQVTFVLCSMLVRMI